MVVFDSKAWIYSESSNLRNCPRCGGNFDLYQFKDRDAKICRPCRVVKPKAIRGNKCSLLGKPLSFRESQIVELVAQGCLNKEIATALHLTEGTIKVFLWIVFAKTGLDNRTKLAVWWIRKSDNPHKSE